MSESEIISSTSQDAGFVPTQAIHVHPMEDQRPKGFGGWLLIPLFSIIINPFILFRDAFTTFKLIFYGNTWVRLTNATSPGFDPLWSPALIFEMTTSLLLFIPSIYLVYCFLTKKRSTPNLYIILLVLGIVSILINFTFALSIHNFSKGVLLSREFGIIRIAAISLIWIPYFLKSKRVKNTFIR